MHLPSSSSSRLTATALAVTLLASLFTALLPAAPARAATETLPDLRMQPVRALSITLPGDGRKLLRFPTTIMNTGRGRFETNGRRADRTVAEMTTTQRIYHTDGSFRDVATPARMYYSGDGHDHWHVRDLQRFRLHRLTDGMSVGRMAKRGFCFWDNTPVNLRLPGAPATKQYLGCGRAGHLTVRMGLSVGWGDTYSTRLRDQYLEITGLPDGTYRLVVEADPSNWFREANDENNVTSTVLRIRGTTVAILPEATYVAPLRTAVRQLAVAAENNAGYDRVRSFGTWIDADRDCLTTRDEVLVAESRLALTYAARGCTVAAGRWRSFFDGTFYTLASQLQVDHAVPAAEAWGSGARSWTQARRVAFFNDLGAAYALNPMSMAQSVPLREHGPERWMPPVNRCRYVEIWTAVKHRWGLRVDPVERAALIRYADACPNNPVGVVKA